MIRPKIILNTFSLWHRGNSCAQFRKSWKQCRYRVSLTIAAMDRHIPNKFPDYSGQQIAFKDDATGKFKLDESFSQAIRQSIPVFLSRMEKGLAESVRRKSRNDTSVYTGQTGIAMLYLHVFHTQAVDPQQHLGTAEAYVSHLMGQVGGNSDVYTFLCGDVGILALSAVVWARTGKMDRSQESLKRLEKLAGQVSQDPNVADEHLYGRAGYLAALMFVRKHLGEQVISSQAICQVVKAMLSSGRALAKRKHSQCPLMYRWYGEYYLGAAHGLAGIFYTLMLVKEAEMVGEVRAQVRPCLDHLLTLQLPSGNFTPALGEHDDRLVHWCHGAPGWVSMWALAFQVYGDDRYLQAALQCGEVVWSRGLLKKGYGLCHGAAGNAYTFLTLFRLTHDQKHIYRACKFAEWCLHYGEHGCRTPDNPYSLFEGMAGTIYFLCDLLDPLSSRFPCYEF